MVPPLGYAFGNPWGRQCSMTGFCDHQKAIPSDKPSLGFMLSLVCWASLFRNSVMHVSKRAFALGNGCSDDEYCAYVDLRMSLFSVERFQLIRCAVAVLCTGASMLSRCPVQV